MKKILCVCLLAAVSAACLAAQDVFATIGGTILDPSGAAVSNVKVTVTNTDRNQVIRTVTSDVNGVYSAPLLPIGAYSVKVEVSGFKTETRTGIVVNVADDLKINMSLQVGAITDAIEVKEEVTPVETGTAAAATTIDGTQVRELALNTRNYEALVALMPGGLKHVFYTNSGSESVEMALKMAIAYHRVRGEGSRVRLIGREKGYHGVNFGGMSVGGMVANRKMFGTLLAGVDHIRHTHGDPREGLNRHLFAGFQFAAVAFLASALWLHGVMLGFVSGHGFSRAEPIRK